MKDHILLSLTYWYQNSFHYSLIPSTKCPEVTPAVTILHHSIYRHKTQCWRYLLPIDSHHCCCFYEHVVRSSQFWEDFPNITAVSNFFTTGVPLFHCGWFSSILGYWVELTSTASNPPNSTITGTISISMALRNNKDSVGVRSCLPVSLMASWLGETRTMIPAVVSCIIVWYVYFPSLGVDYTLPPHWYQAWCQTCGASPCWSILHPCPVKLTYSHMTCCSQQNVGGRDACHFCREALRVSLWFCYLSLPTALRLAMSQRGAAASAWILE